MSTTAQPLGDAQFKLNLKNLPTSTSRPNSARPASAKQFVKTVKGGNPLTADVRRVARQLRTELQSVIITTRKMLARVDQTLVIIQGTQQQLQGTASSTRERLAQNPRMVKAANEGDRTQKPIVAAMESLAASSERSSVALLDVEATLASQQELLQEVIEVLNAQWAGRNDVLESAAGGLAASSGPVLDDQETHAWLADAARKEDSARGVVNRALAVARDCAAKLERGKSQVQVSVRTSRDNVVKAKRAQKTGNFGSTGARETNPAERKIALNPESKGHESW